MTRDTADERSGGSRRDVLRAIGVCAFGATPVFTALAGASGRGPPERGRWLAQAAPNATSTTTANATRATGRSDRRRTTVVLGGETDGWLGLAPDAIQGVRNPTLPLRPGETHRVVWVNLDGEQHQFQVLDGADRPLVGTEPTGSVGTTRAVSFDATEEMAAYRCRFHPERMRGAVGLGTPDAASGNRTAENRTAGDEVTTPTGDETVTPTGEVVEVAVGPEGNYFRFVPETVTVAVGGTVRWTAESVGHNVSGRPGDSDVVELPEGAEPFSSYPPGESFAIIPEGEAYEHTFTVPGEYVYVCLPHVSEGMVGTVRVTE